MLARPWCPSAPTAAGSNPRPLSSIRESQVPVRLADDRDHRARRPGVARDVAERLVHDAEQVGGRVRRRGSPSSSSGIQLDVDHRVVAELVDDRGERRPSSVSAAQELRPQAEDEVADVADRQVEAVDRALDAPLDLVRVVAP